MVSASAQKNRCGSQPDAEQPPTFVNDPYRQVKAESLTAPISKPKERIEMKVEVEGAVAGVI